MTSLEWHLIDWQTWYIICLHFILFLIYNHMIGWLINLFMPELIAIIGCHVLEFDYAGNVIYIYILKCCCVLLSGLLLWVLFNNNIKLNSIDWYFCNCFLLFFLHSRWSVLFNPYFRLEKLYFYRLVTTREQMRQSILNLLSEISLKPDTATLFSNNSPLEK